jgi:hypothetical protein
VTDFELTDELQAVLSQPAVTEWLIENVECGLAAAFNEAGAIVLRFQDDGEAEAFRREWLRAA